MKNMNYESCETENQQKKKTPLQWSITSLESHQVINCDEITIKVNFV